jgi:hypothetical protein
MIGERLRPPGSSRVTAAEFTRDGRTLVTAGFDSESAQLWDLGGLQDMRADPRGAACRITGGGMTVEEWNRYVADDWRETCPP